MFISEGKILIIPVLGLFNMITIFQGQFLPKFLWANIQFILLYAG